MIRQKRQLSYNMEQLVIYNKEQYRSQSGARPLITSLQLTELITYFNQYNNQEIQGSIVTDCSACCQIDGIGMTSRSVYNVLYTLYCMCQTYSMESLINSAQLQLIWGLLTLT